MAKLRSGITTGTCAAIAAKAAAELLLGQNAADREWIVTPSGRRIETEIRHIEATPRYAVCAVKKYSGDDPDVTDGVLVYAKVRRIRAGIAIDGGEGVGRVTRPGLDQPVGAAAINSVPRQMITDAVTEAIERSGEETGMEIVISIPEGVKLAEKTFNPRLGIEGGISVLGTSGIVEPMSEKAVIATIAAELDVRKAAGKDYVMIAPGNYGREYIRREFGADIGAAVKCSNFIGDTIDLIKDRGFKGFTLTGHAGKLIKLAAGIMNTHSSYADGRMEVLCTHAALCGGSTALIKSIYKCVTTDEAASLLSAAGLLGKTMESVRERTEFYLGKRCGGTGFAFVMFYNGAEELCRGGSTEILHKTMEEYI